MSTPRKPLLQQMKAADSGFIGQAGLNGDMVRLVLEEACANIPTVGNPDENKAIEQKAIIIVSADIDNPNSVLYKGNYVLTTVSANMAATACRSV